ncbi:hypothetical protein F183_A25500 [Bryobacterales bacterium F-183]|nr:hypothetical protein F183_A25500 [Bryobacterales bacterium F-183]
MTIAIDPKVGARLNEKAIAEGLTVAAYIERLVRIEDAAEAELESLALAGIASGNSLPAEEAFWQERYNRVANH